MRSLKFGPSQMTLVFEEGTDIFRARQLVSEFANAADDLPANVPQTRPDHHRAGEIFYYVVDYKPDYNGPDKPKTRDRKQLWSRWSMILQDRLLLFLSQLRSVPGIAEAHRAATKSRSRSRPPRSRRSQRRPSRNWRIYRGEYRECRGSAIQDRRERPSARIAG